MKKIINAIIKAVVAGVFIGAKTIIVKYEIALLYVLIRILDIGGMVFGVLAVSTLVEAILSNIKPKSKRTKTGITVFLSLWKYLVAILILCWGLTIFGVNVNTIVASVGIIALVVGFSAESLIADLITGLFMLFENQHNVGDIIEVDGYRGTVVAIGIRTTSIEDGSKNIKIINNSEMKNLVNKSKNTSKAVCDFGIPYETDLEDLEKKIPGILKDIYIANEGIMNAEPVYLGVQELGSSSVVLRFVVDVEEHNLFNATRVMNRELLIRMKKIGIESPFSQVVVHGK